MALAETSYFLQPYVYLTLADPAMPNICGCRFTPLYTLCKPLVTQATTVKDWVWVLRHTTPLTHIKFFLIVCLMRAPK